MAGDDHIFPLLDRRAPLLDRIREDNDQDQLTNLVSEIISDSVKSDDEELIQETKERINQSVTEKLANDFGVKESDISTDFVNEVSDMLVTSTEADVLTEEAAERLGIKEVDEETEDQEGSELFDS